MTACVILSLLHHLNSKTMLAGSTTNMLLIANAQKAQGVIVQVEPGDFMAILKKTELPLVVHAQSKILKVTYKYLTTYKGLAFYTKTPDPLHFNEKVEVIMAKKLGIPEL